MSQKIFNALLLFIAIFGFWVISTFVTPCPTDSQQFAQRCNPSLVSTIPRDVYYIVALLASGILFIKWRKAKQKNESIDIYRGLLGVVGYAGMAGMLTLQIVMLW